MPESYQRDWNLVTYGDETVTELYWANIDAWVNTTFPLDATDEWKDTKYSEYKALFTKYEDDGAITKEEWQLVYEELAERFDHVQYFVAIAGDEVATFDEGTARTYYEQNGLP
jgi:hypothetical protein